MLKVFTLLADWLTYEVAGLAPLGRWADAMHFFVEDVSKILVLVTVLIFVIGVLRAGVDSERIRDFLSGKRRGLGYAMASGFGAVTPFCSCSSIPLFLGFTAARIPLGITMAFLITSPMINEVAIVLMGGLLGWRFLAVYVAIGLGAGMLGGAFLDRIGAERYLMPVGQAVMKNAGEGKGAIPASGESDTEESKSETSQTVSSRRSSIDFRSRLDFAAGETKSILKKIWIWVLVGVGLGAAIHGFVPESLISENLGRGAWWSVPAAVLLGIPLYGGASATVPVVGSLIAKGLPVGTATVFMMSVVAVSFPEFVMLKQVMKPKLLLIFLRCCWCSLLWRDGY
jgi:uncharacterized membrane protein YraQ (UPF0718 family)